MSDDQDGCEWVNVSSGNKRACVLQYKTVLNYEVLKYMCSNMNTSNCCFCVPLNLSYLGILMCNSTCGILLNCNMYIGSHIHASEDLKTKI